MNFEIENGQKELANRRKLAGIDVPLSTDKPSPKTTVSLPLQDATRSPQKPQNERKPDARVKVYPTLAKAFLQQDPRNDRRTLASVGRVYFLLRAYDQQGSGKIPINDATLYLASCTNSTRRNIRGILKQGSGLSWQLSKRYIYLSSAANIAIALDAGSLKGKPVYIPVPELTAGIQQVRATFLAAYHSGRDTSEPTSRQKIRIKTGIPERTQQVYDKVTETASTKNYGGNGELATKANMQRRYLEHGAREYTCSRTGASKYGSAVFRHRDSKGNMVIAWRLPNSYDAIYEQAPKGRQRKHNRRINLVIKRQQGNDFEVMRMYHPNVRIAARYKEAYPEREHYYPVGRQLTFTAGKPSKLEGADFWALL